MHDLATIIGSYCATAIKVNKIYVRANYFEEHVQQFCEPAIFRNDFPGFQMTKGGSSFRIKIENRYFVMASYHQIIRQNYDFAQFCLYNRSKSTLVSSQAAFFPEGSQIENDDHDFVLFEFSSPVSDGALESYPWYDLTGEMHLTGVPKPSLGFCVGFPGEVNKIDYENNIFNATAFGIRGEETRPTVSGRLAFKPKSKLLVDPSGMSGGPVFGVRIDRQRVSAFFAGIITDASRSKIHFISWDRIKLAIVDFL